MTTSTSTFEAFSVPVPPLFFPSHSSHKCVLLPRQTVAPRPRPRSRVGAENSQALILKLDRFEGTVDRSLQMRACMQPTRSQNMGPESQNQRRLLLFGSLT